MTLETAWGVVLLLAVVVLAGVDGFLIAKAWQRYQDWKQYLQWLEKRAYESLS